MAGIESLRATPTGDMSTPQDILSAQAKVSYQVNKGIVRAQQLTLKCPPDGFVASLKKVVPGVAVDY
jgi:hypothetical protein